MDGVNGQGSSSSGGGIGGFHHRGHGVSFAIRRRINRQAARETYMECRRNVSLAVGQHAVDGCRGFLKVAAAAAGGGVGRGVAIDQDIMLCDACGCHRNFHRKVVRTQVRAVEPPSFVLFGANRPFLHTPERPMLPPLPPMPMPVPMPVVDPEMPDIEIVESETEDEGSDKSEIYNEDEQEDEGGAETVNMEEDRARNSNGV
ncbi:hypothetical protein PTKIN_Ptkin10aG0186300 [Pterospermum kingtungense]